MKISETTQVSLTTSRYFCDIDGKPLLAGQKPHRCGVCEREVCQAHEIWIRETMCHLSVCTHCHSLRWRLIGWDKMQDAYSEYRASLARLLAQWAARSREIRLPEPQTEDIR